jgi:hypothetical protein
VTAKNALDPVRTEIEMQMAAPTFEMNLIMHRAARLTTSANGSEAKVACSG